MNILSVIPAGPRSGPGQAPESGRKILFPRKSMSQFVIPAKPRGTGALALLNLAFGECAERNSTGRAGIQDLMDMFSLSVFQTSHSLLSITLKSQGEDSQHGHS
jgi:hypothetical protein